MPSKSKNIDEAFAVAPESGFSKEFAAHLRRIRRAKLAADKIASEANSAVPADARSASVEILWEMIFDRLCESAELSLADIGALAAIAQKLSALKPGGDARAAASGGIRPETLSKIEERLGLL